MKKLALKISCLFLMLLGASSARADGAAFTDSGSHLGIEGGLNLANFNGQNINDVFASRLGFVGGAYLQFPLAPGWGLQPELLYEQKGGKFNGNPYQENYVEVPVLLNIRLFGPLSLLAGPSFDANVYNSGINNVNSGDIGLVGGAQLNFAQWLISARYEAGLTNVSTTQGFQNGTFTLMAGLALL